MGNFLKIGVLLIMLFVTHLANAESPSWNLQIVNQLPEDFTFSTIDKKSVIASANQDQAVLTIPFQSDYNEGVINVYDSKKHLLANIHYALKQVFTYVAGALAGPDWQWQPIEIVDKSDGFIKMTVTQDTVGSCAEGALQGCSQTAKITISR